MSKSGHYDLLCCPACRGDLDVHVEDERLRCDACQFEFPIIQGIPVLFPCNVVERMDELFGRYWDTEEKAELYDTKVEGDEDVFGTYNHESEVYALVEGYEPSNLDVVLDAGCGNGRFLDTFPSNTVTVGIDASLNLLQLVKKRGRGDFLVCGELEHLPFKDGAFGTVITCRVLQHLHQQEAAVLEMSRVTREYGNVILELYNTWNLKTIYKEIRMSPRLRKALNAPFRLVFRSMSPFGDWNLDYDNYNSWFEVKPWLRRANLGRLEGRGAGFGYHKYFLQPFYIEATLRHIAPNLLRRYFALCFAIEKMVGGWIPLRYFLEKIVMKTTKLTPEKR